MTSGLFFATVFFVTIAFVMVQSPLASAQTEAPGQLENKGAGTVVFDADYFEDAQPQNALDMLLRLPGFKLDSGDSGVRGYSGSAGNVLIDGKRPVSKYDDLESILGRINASAVVHIELIRGSAPGIDMQSQEAVANIIRSTETMEDRMVRVGLYQHFDGRLMPEGQINSSWRRDGRLLEASLRGYEMNDEDSGHGYRQRVNTSGEVLRHEISDVEASEKVINATVGYEQPALGGDLRLNLVLIGETKQFDEAIEETIPRTAFSETSESRDRNEAEFGLYFNRDLNSGKRFSLLAIQHLLNTDKVEQDLGEFEYTVFENEGKSGESVIRAAINQPMAKDVELEWGMEAAYNYLNSTSVTTENGVVIPLPASSVKVKEERAEGFANVSWTPAENLSLEAALAFEYSNISQTGDSASEKSLYYLKPGFNFSWSPTSSDQIRGGVQREVGQLDFDDFVTSADLATGTVNIGNPELEPDTSWVFALTWEKTFVSDTTAVLTLEQSFISDVVDIVPIYVPIEGSDEYLILAGVGNIGNGEVTEVQLGLNIPTDEFGIAGGLFQADITYRKTSVRDPLTGEGREISGMDQPWEGSIEWTQDLPQQRFRWGAEITLAESEPQYRIDQVRKETIQATLGVSAEYFPSTHWSISLELQNLTSSKFGLEKEIYDAPRNTGAIEAFEVQSWKSKPYVYLSLRWQI